MEKAENSNEELKNRRRNLVETCKIHRFLKEVTNMAIILDVFYNCNNLYKYIKI